MTDKVFEQIMAIRKTGKVNMLSVKEVFELALITGRYELAEYIFDHSEAYCKFVISGERE